MSVWSYVKVDPASQIPLATQISQQIKWLIASNKIEPEMKLPPVRQLGEQLGISFHTVRAAYQQLEAEGLVATRQGIGTTVVDVEISALSSPSSSVPSFAIGVIIPAFAGFYAPLLQGIYDAARDDPSLFFICDSQENRVLAEYYLDQLLARGVDGIILVSRDLSDPEKARRISENPDSFPAIVFADIPTYPQPLILFDLEEGAYQAARHLLEHGHERVGLITPPGTWLNVAPKHRGYARAFAEAGIAFPSDLLAEVPNYRLESGNAGAVRLLNLSDLPTAIIGDGGTLALGVYRAIKEQGLRIPDDVAVIGSDDYQIAALVEPPLTTIDLPAYEMGRQSYLMLQQTMSGDVPDQQEIVLPTELHIRRSCGCEGRLP